MPLVFLQTNLKDSDVKEGIEQRIAQGIADTLGKPLDKMVVVVVPGVRLFRRGSSEPACTLNIHSIGVFDAERNPKYGPYIKQLLKEELGLEEDRCSVIYHDLDANFIG